MIRLAVIIFYLLFHVGFSNAQSAVLPPRVVDTLRSHMKKELRFTLLQIDSVLFIEKEFMARNEALKSDQNSSEDDRNIQLKSLAGERRLRLRTILTAYQLTRLEGLLDRMKAMLHE